MQAFKDRQGQMMVIYKVLYGLWTSGLMWHERLAECLQTMWFTISKVEPDIWFKRHKNKSHYVTVHVDGLAFAIDDPESFIKKL